MKIKINYHTGVLLFILTILIGCSKKDEKYKDLIKGGEIYYPGVVSNTGFRAGNLRTQLVWAPSPDPKITTYKIFWNNKLDSLIIPATSHNPLDTFKVTIPGLREGTYNFIINTIDDENNVSIPINLNGVRVYGPVYLSGLFNRGYNADRPYEVDIPRGNVKLNFNRPDSINTKTVINFTDNSGRSNVLTLSPDSNSITLRDFKFGTNIVYQSSYIPQRGAIDVFTVSEPTTFPEVKRTGDVTALFIKNPGNPFQRGDNGGGKWGLPKDWQVTPNVINQDNNRGGGWSWDFNGVVHVESKDYNGAPVINGKVFQTISLPAGTYQYDVTAQNFGGNINANEVVAEGSSLPDIDNLNGNNAVLAMFHGDQNSIGGTHSMTFTLTRQTTVTIGWVLTLQSSTYLQFKGVSLRLLN